MESYSYITGGRNPKKAEDSDRDQRFMAMTRARGDISRGVVSATKQGCRSPTWGGALRRMTSTTLGPSREDEFKFVDVPGRYVPLGFARYVSPTIDPLDYQLFRIAGWRVAVPRSLPGITVRDLLFRIFIFGPASAGYVRISDTLVPATLEGGDRMTLAQSTLGAQHYPLTQ